MSTRDTVVVLRALGLGDLCTGVPALKAIRRAFPEARMALAAPRWQAPLVEALGLSVVPASSSLQPLPPTVQRCALAVNLHGKGPESTRRLLERRPRRLIAFRHTSVSPTAGMPPWTPDEHEVDRWCRLLRECGIAADRTELGLPRPGVAPPVAAGTVLVHPGAGAPARRWPTDRFGAVVRRLYDDGHRVALTGSASEAGICGSVAAHADRPVTNLAGRTDLLQLCAAVAEAGAVVSNDTGVGHLATAYRTPSVLLFGPTAPAQWGPPPTGRHVTIWKGHRGDPHGTSVHHGLAAIGVAEVLDAFTGISTVAV